eukprot:SAG11_NODE_9051_length_949_cov_0.785882_2_plen_175_part_00
MEPVVQVEELAAQLAGCVVVIPYAKTKVRTRPPPAVVMQQQHRAAHYPSAAVSKSSQRLHHRPPVIVIIRNFDIYAVQISMELAARLPDLRLVQLMSAVRRSIGAATAYDQRTARIHCQKSTLVKSQRYAIQGFDHIDVNGLAALGISVANNGGANAVAVAEHTIGLILSLYRR